MCIMKFIIGNHQHKVCDKFLFPSLDQQKTCDCTHNVKDPFYFNLKSHLTSNISKIQNNCNTNVLLQIHTKWKTN